MENYGKLAIFQADKQKIFVMEAKEVSDAEWTAISNGASNVTITVKLKKTDDKYDAVRAYIDSITIS